MKLDELSFKKINIVFILSVKLTGEFFTTKPTFIDFLSLFLSYHKHVYHIIFFLFLSLLRYRMSV